MTEEFQKNKEKAKELRKQLDEIQESLTNAVIIDGVNVAGCDFVSKIGGCDSYTDGVCEGHNCEHKQLKRLEQDSKQLTQWLDEARNNADFWCNKCTSLVQENKDFEILAKSLYKRIEELEKENEALAFRERLYKADYEASEQENRELRKANEISIEKVTVTAEAKRLQELEQENKQMKSALEEILEIIRADCKRCTAECDCDDDCTRYKIKNKIKEVLE